MRTIDLSGQWKIYLEADEGIQQGEITLPGILQGQGYGNPISYQTPWVSGLHDAFWYEQEEYKQAQGEEVLVSFLAQPPRHFLGKAYYEREFVVEENREVYSEDWFLRMELTRWRSKVWIDDVYRGEDCSLCTAHEIPCGKLSPGNHVIKVCIDNSMQYPYRPDGHGVSDALGATWNGMVGELVLETASAKRAREEACREYAAQHPRRIEAKDGKFYIDGHAEYFRGTHFGGEYPLTGYPIADKSWWLSKMEIIKEWGLNAIRFHSYCPPEAAFAAADEAGVYLLVECGMWNIFREGLQMLEVLRSETQRILKQFGHHPSFAFFSPSNEPGGRWYQVLQNWVRETREYDKALGYEGRRLYSAQSGWFFNVPPAEITGTDFVYLHRSNYGTFPGGNIRSFYGWKGKDYSSSLEGVKQPVICHELGQWCAYPDFDSIRKFTGYMKPGNYMVFREQAGKQGLLPLNKRLAWCSGRNQLRLYKEELEANFRTPEITGFELLDLHDYLGQGTALVGLLDAFWESKGYATPEEIRAFCGETVLLVRCPSYVWKNTDMAEIPVEVCHFGKEALHDGIVRWSLECASQKVYGEGYITCPVIKCGENTLLGNISLDFSGIRENSHLILTLSMGNVENHWDLYVYAEESSGCADIQKDILKNEQSMSSEQVLYTHSWQEALASLEQGGSVIYSPYLSDLDYECPSLSIRNVFWNSQMGPTWGRSVGLVVEKEHPLFKTFPTEESGGWQWEDILEHARGFDLRGMEGISPVVRPIDDWNRSLPLGLIFEAKVGKGKLLLVSADLEGDFAQRPAAYCLKQAILQYVASTEFNPENRLMPGQITEKLFPVQRTRSLVQEWTVEDAEVERSVELFTANPNRSVRIRKADFPVTINITLKKAVKARGWVYLPEQNDRAHEGFLKDYVLEYLDAENNWKQASEGSFLNTGLSQKVIFREEIIARKWRFTVYSCYGCVDKEVWKSSKEGWIKVFQPKSAVLQIAGLHLLCEEETEHSMNIFWQNEPKFATKKEIEN